MPRRGVTVDDVADAVLRLKKAGHPVTTANIRRELGRGSYTTLGRHLTALGARENGRPRADEAMPRTLEAICQGFAQRTWQTLQQQVRSRDSEVTAPLRSKVTELRAKLTALGDHRDRLLWEATEVRRELDAATAHVKELTARLAQAREELAVERRLRKRHEARFARGTSRRRRINGEVAAVDQT